MDFDFNQEQAMLRDLTREFLARECSPRFVRQMMEDPTGFGEPMWQQMAEMGLQGIAIPAAYGGQGLGMVELALVLEEMGRSTYLGPYFATVVLAAPAIEAGGDPVQMQTYLPAIAAGKLKGTLALLEDALAWGPEGIKLDAVPRGSEYLLSGVKRFVPFAHAADFLLIAARTGGASDDGSPGITVFVLEPGMPGLMLEPNVGMDRTSRTSTLVLDDVRVGRDRVVGCPDEGWGILEPTLRRAAVGASAEMLGAARKCLEMSVEYAGVREQFGQPIGSFQAIKHMCAEMLMEVETAHAATYYAAWALAAGAPDAPLAASVAKAHVSEAARKVCGAAIQVHGGIGYTWEYDLHLSFKRAKHLEPLYGDANFHRELALRHLLVPSREAVLV
jgi:alkylation response protein AidB-like acyl-CoA dehydrogenase